MREQDQTPEIDNQVNYKYAVFMTFIFILLILTDDFITGW